MSIHEEMYPDDNGCMDGLRALGRAPETDTMSCKECPFPFCVRAEARRLKNLARDISIMAMHGMHASAKLIATRIGVNLDTVYGVVEKSKMTQCCYWCKLDHKEAGVFCRPSSCTVAYDCGSIAVTLPAHRKATDHEVSIIETFVGNMFPDGVLTSVNDSPHDHWTVGRVEEDEASTIYNRMTELAGYTAHLR